MLQPIVIVFKTVGLAALFYTCAEDPVAVTILLCATVSSIAGFAFSALSGSVLLHFVSEPMRAVEIMLVASIALQSYAVWTLRSAIAPRELAPYFLGGIAAIAPGVYLLLNTPKAIYLIALGAFLTAYGGYSLIGSPLRLASNNFAGRILVGALGGLGAATAAFPGAFVTIWCSAHGWDKQRQRGIYQPFILGMQVLTLVALCAAAPPAQLGSIPVAYVVPALVGSYFGLWAFRQLSTAQFNKVVSTFLLVSGGAMLINAV